MAILDGGPNGGFRGKVGSVVGYLRYGNYVIRGLPKRKKRKCKPTEKQAVNRAGFNAVQHFLSPLLPFIRVGYKLEARAKHMSAHNAAKSNMMLSALNPAGELVYSKINLSVGDLTGVNEARIAVDEQGLQVSWENPQRDEGAGDNDQVMLALYCVELHSASFILSGARRSAGHESLTLKSFAAGYCYHVWIAFIADDRQRISTSTYINTVST